MPNGLAVFLRMLVLALIVFLLSWLANKIAKLLIIRIVGTVIRRTKNTWDDIFLEQKVFNRLSHIAPALVIYFMAGWALGDYPGWLTFVRKLTYIYMILASTISLEAFISAWHVIYQQFPISRERNIKGYVQLVKILVFIFAGLWIIALLFDKDVGKVIAGLGALAAVLILVFRDTILGLVASIQMSANKMVKLGDWIEMPSRKADGNVIDISLNTVKVRNWDMTISTIPTYAMVSESFINWRGMEESGGRRIKRSVLIDMQTVKFATAEMVEKYKTMRLLKDYVEKKASELKEHNQKHGIDDSVLINGRRMTNLGTFRAYLKAYLKDHPKIHNDMTFLVRQLHPTDKGIPIEIYVFSRDQAWANYEDIQGDIFDHILAVVPEFDLKVYQSPSGEDLRQIRI